MNPYHLSKEQLDAFGAELVPPKGYREHLLRQAISEAKEELGEKRTKQIIAEELDQ